MRIRIKRTSMWSFDVNKPPHIDAFIARLPKYRTHVRTCKSFQEFDERFSATGGAWLSEGINHRIEDGCIMREEPQEGYGWYIRISSMKELEKFIKENGECVLDHEHGEMTLEIYDDYRE